MNINDKLCTKDGRKIGNAIIIGMYESDYPELGLMYKVKTDYGNVCRFTEKEIESLFYTEQREETIPEYENLFPHKYAV